MSITKLPIYNNDIYFLLDHFKFCSQEQKDAIYQYIIDNLLQEYGKDRILSALDSLRAKCDLYPLPCYIYRELNDSNTNRSEMIIDRIPDFFNYTLHKIDEMIEVKMKDFGGHDGK